MVKKIILDKSILRKYQRKTILITGASGYLGSKLAKVLSNIDCTLILLDRIKTDQKWLVKNKATIIKNFGDISKKRTWKKILSSKINCVFHLAAREYNRQYYNFNNDFQTNALAVFYLVEACCEKKLFPKIIFASSANVYQTEEHLLINEKTIPVPLSMWSAHKLLAEYYLQIYKRKYKLNSVVLRFSNIYGPTINKKKESRVIINSVIQKALNNHYLTVFNNKHCVRDYIYIDDAIGALIYAGVYNKALNKDFYIIGSGQGGTIVEIWRKMAEYIQKKTNKEINIKYDRNAVLEPFDFRNFIADSALFAKTTGWRCHYSLEEGLKKTIDFFMRKIKEP